MEPSKLYLLEGALALVSSYANSLSHSLPASERRPLKSAQASLTLQLEELRALLNAGKLESDRDHVISNVVLCSHYFEYMSALIERRWPHMLSSVRGSEMFQQLITVGHASFLHHDRLLFLAGRTRGMLSQNHWAEFFVTRFAAAVELYNEFAKFANQGESLSDRDSLSRTLVFEPEHKQAAISILSYFGDIVSQKYPDIDVGVRIEQHGTKITLVVETPRGELERIEQELSDYGLVVTGQVSPEQYLTRPGEAMMLRHKLEMAQLEIRQTRELLASERAGFGARIESLELNVQFMRSMLDKAQYESAAASSAIREIATSNTAVVAKLLEDLSSLVAKHSNDDHDKAVATLRKIHDASPSVIDRLNELFVRGAIQGAAGNYLYAALTALQKVLI